MADLEATKHAPILPSPKLGKLPSGDLNKSRRHVAFSEIPAVPVPVPKQQQVIIDERDTHTHEERCRPCCFMCCAWTCLGICTLALILLILGVSFYAVVHSWLPEIRIEKLSFNQVDFVTSSDKMFLNAAGDVVFQVSNKNENVALLFTSLAVDVSWEQIKLGQANIPGFSLNPKNTTTLKVHSGVSRSEVDSDDKDAITTSLKNKEMDIDLFLTGKIGFDLGGLQMKGLPLQIVCEDINQNDVDHGREPTCNVKIFSFGATFHG